LNHCKKTIDELYKYLHEEEGEIPESPRKSKVLKKKKTSKQTKETPSKRKISTTPEKTSKKPKLSHNVIECISFDRNAGETTDSCKFCNRVLILSRCSTSAYYFS
jgi:hypothetical protein